MRPPARGRGRGEWARGPAPFAGPALAMPPQGRSDGQTVGPMGAKRPDRAARGSAPRRATPAERGPSNVWRAAALPSAPGAWAAASVARHRTMKRPRRRDTSPSVSEAKRQRGPALIPRAPPMMPDENKPEIYERSGAGQAATAGPKNKRNPRQQPSGGQRPPERDVIQNTYFVGPCAPCNLG